MQGGEITRATAVSTKRRRRKRRRRRMTGCMYAGIRGSRKRRSSRRTPGHTSRHLPPPPHQNPLHLPHSEPVLGVRPSHGDRGTSRCRRWIGWIACLLQASENMCAFASAEIAKTGEITWPGPDVSHAVLCMYVTRRYSLRTDTQRSDAQKQPRNLREKTASSSNSYPIKI
ncbi:hypothetical protein BD289DRAFT_200549 [Coniella lustricola]|uniref:Uncharacterized protein n=1 Tax=Coniella lustricola TaxID=2025994 RepID=A0A2T2ZSI9_9PEZI|nr:hypothetical protein BD289DRAFT_200549 [Coniella lustricola]